MAANSLGQAHRRAEATPALDAIQDIFFQMLPRMCKPKNGAPMLHVKVPARYLNTRFFTNLWKAMRFCHTRTRQSS